MEPNGFFICQGHSLSVPREQLCPLCHCMSCCRGDVVVDTFSPGHNGLSGSMLLFLALHCFFLMCLLPQKENALVKVADIALGSWEEESNSQWQGKENGWWGTSGAAPSHMFSIGLPRRGWSFSPPRHSGGPHPLWSWAGPPHAHQTPLSQASIFLRSTRLSGF